MKGIALARLEWQGRAAELGPPQTGGLTQTEALTVYAEWLLQHARLTGEERSFWAGAAACGANPMKGIAARLARLEEQIQEAASRRQLEEDSPPNVTGRPRDVARCEYLEWLRKRLRAPDLSPENRTAIGRTIDEMTRIVAGIENRLRLRAPCDLTEEERTILDTAARTLRAATPGPAT
jgi:hypothetical protein